MSRRAFAAMAARPTLSRASRSCSRSKLAAIESPLAQIPPHRAHHLDEAREARCDERGVVDLHGLLARKPHHERGHGDAMFHGGGARAPAGPAPLAVPNRAAA